MPLPSLQLQPISTSHYYISGDVTIQAGVAIAPGVLIQADPESCIIIKTGACIGIGAILHAHNGTLEIGEGANIGAEVLLVGQVRIGANACIGAATTVFNSSVEWGQIVPPGSLIGDFSRQPAELRATNTVIYPASKPESTPGAAIPAVPSEPGNETKTVIGNSSSLENPTQQGINVYGQVYVNQLLVKLFPNRPSDPATLPAHGTTPSSPDDPWDD
ncbi:MAG: hypothetical protein HC866_07685 [Leptolyngbyaceae cyanobacterium RU_5_1]|nr:hypothetical protein [Leptolyngbyaceae cyanobacterium RU_5_1]